MKKVPVKKIILCAIFFFGLLLFNLFLSPLNLDEIWSYGFAHNIVTGLLPYRDFNMVISPFHPFLVSIFLGIFGDSLLTFHIFNALLGTILILLIDSVISKRVWILLPFFFFPQNITFPNYNYFLIFLFVFYWYGEKKSWNDYLLGMILSLFFWTKQSVGLIFLFSILVFYKDWKKIGKRLLSFCFISGLFVVYLLFTNSFSSFLDLCFFGLFDFGSGNSNTFSPFFFLFLFLEIIILILFLNNRKNYYYYYLLLFGSICVPLFDLYHFQIFLIAFLAVFFYYHNFSKIHYFLIGTCLTVGIFFVYFYYSTFDGVYPNSFSHFEYRYMSSMQESYTNETIKSMEKYNYNVMFIDPNAYYFKIILNQKINYLDLINTGNFGYHGSEKLLEQVKSLDSSVVFFVSINEVGSGKQTDQKLIQYILKNGKKIDENAFYDIYRLGEDSEEVFTK